MNKGSKGRSRGGNKTINSKPIRSFCSAAQSRTQQRDTPQIGTCAYAGQNSNLDPAIHSMGQCISSNESSSKLLPTLVRSVDESPATSNKEGTNNVQYLFSDGLAGEPNISIKDSSLILIPSVEPNQLNENLSSNKTSNEEIETMERYLAEAPSSYYWEKLFHSIPEFSDNLPPLAIGRRRVSTLIPQQSPNIENARRNDQEEFPEQNNEVHQEEERTYCFDPIDYDSPFEESEVEEYIIPDDARLSINHADEIVDWVKEEKDGQKMKTRSIQGRIKEVESAISTTRGDFEDVYFTIHENRVEDQTNLRGYLTDEFHKFDRKLVAFDGVLNSFHEDWDNITHTTQNTEKTVNELIDAVHSLYFYNAHGRYPDNIQKGERTSRLSLSKIRRIREDCNSCDEKGKIGFG